MTLEQIKLKPLTEKELEQVLELDDLCFGGLWSLEGYKREIDSPNSCLLIICLERENPEKIISYFIKKYQQKTAFSNSFQAEGQVVQSWIGCLLHLVSLVVLPFVLLSNSTGPDRGAGG